jgi:hypothetical protein
VRAQIRVAQMPLALEGSFTLTFFKMEKLSKLQELFRELEQLTEDQQGHLIGGFATIGGPQTALFEGDNNCHGGNCATNCGDTTKNGDCVPMNGICLQSA